MHSEQTRRQAVNPPGSAAWWPTAWVQGSKQGPLSTGTVVTRRLALGTHALHRLLSHSARQNHLNLAFDLGIRHFDTAPSYGAGLAERELGHFVRHRRSALLVTSKFGIHPSRWSTVLPGGRYLVASARVALRAGGWPSHSAHRDYDEAAMRRSVEDSLRRLRTDYLDVLFLHAPEVELIGDAARLIEALRESGKVLRFGLSGQAAHCERIADEYPALAEVLQLQIAAEPNGLPSTTPVSAQAAIGFWEYPAPPRGSSRWPMSLIVARLLRAVPSGVLLLSSPDSDPLRNAAASLMETDASLSPPSPDSAESLQ